ncbi:MAG: protein kinase [Acidobacteriota bacterium]
MTINSGTRLNHYEILSRIGAGGMGEVYLAQDTKLDRKVALKLLPAEFTTDEDRVRRFIQEAKAASALNHPNIITIYEIGEIAGTHFIATEFINGLTLRQHMAKEKMRLHTALEVASQVAFALTAAHEAGIVHRDIKPENVMLRPDGVVKVLDFGLAKLTEQRPATVDTNAPTIGNVKTDPGTVMGTVQYMSPEQARGVEVDARTDLFSLGVVLYEMLSGRVPFAGETASHIIVSILEKEPLPLTRAAPGVPAELERIVTKVLVKDREERYQSAKDLLIDLKRLRARQELEAELARSASPETSDRAGPVTDGREAAQATATQPTAQSGEAITRATSSAKYLISEIRKDKRSVAALLAVLLVAASGAGYWFSNLRSSGSSDAIDSLAVLPFQNRSANADSEYLSDGLAESLIYRLSQLPKLKVSPTSSVFRYKGKETDAQTIGNELGVHAVMSGRIVQRGENLTISVELVDVRNNKTLWGEQYDRKLSDLLATQREMATEIAQRLQLKLSGEAEKGLNKRYTENNEAYQLYLKGRFHYAKRTKDDVQRGIEYFQQAIRLAPTFALAYVGIADSYNSIPFHAYLSPKEAIPQARAAAQRALEIDPTLAEAHAALATPLALSDWNWAEAEREFKRAIELNPNVANIHFYYGLIYLLPRGRTDEAIRELERAVELEPFALIINANLAGAYMAARQNAQALEQARKTYDLEPNFIAGRVWLGQVYNATGMYDDAIALSEKSLQSDPTHQPFLRNAGYAYAKAGRRREAEDVIRRFKDIARTQYVKSLWVATIHAALGERNKAFAELEKAFAERDWDLSRLKVDPFMDSLRDDPRFKDLVRRIGLPK